METETEESRREPVKDQPAAFVRSQDLGDFTLKVAGILLIVRGIWELPSPPAFLFLILAVVFLRGSAVLSRRLFGATAQVAVSIPMRRDLEVVAFRILGLYFLCDGMAYLVQGIAANLGEIRGAADSVFWISFAGTKVVSGLALVLYTSPWFFRLWKKGRRSSQGLLSSTPPKT